MLLFWESNRRRRGHLQIVRGGSQCQNNRPKVIELYKQKLQFNKQTSESVIPALTKPKDKMRNICQRAP